MTPPRADGGIGHNSAANGGPSPLELMQGRVKEYVAAASAWLNQIGEIKTKEQGDAAAAFVRQGSTLASDADKQRLELTRPLDKQKADIKKAWDAIVVPADKARDLVKPKLEAWLKSEEDRIAAEAAAAAKAAREAEEAAMKKAEEAFELHDKAQSGELKDTGVNTVAAMIEAEAAQEAAEKAADDAERLSKRRAGAGGQYSVGGSKRSVTLHTRRYLVLDLPANAPQSVVVTALGKIMLHIVKAQGAGALDDIRQAIGRAASAAWKATGEVPPGCKIETERSAQ